jgi:hypothetical protein
MPLGHPCGNSLLGCTGYAYGPDILCHSCRPACPTCGAPVPDVIIQDEAYRVAKQSHLPALKLQVGENEFVHCRPIPLVIVRKKKKWTAPPKQPLTEAEAEQP